MDTILKILAWLLVPYVMIAIWLSRKTGSKLVGISVGICLFLIIAVIGCTPEENPKIIPESTIASCSPEKTTISKTTPKKLEIEITSSEPSHTPAPKKTAKVQKQNSTSEEKVLTKEMATAILEKSFKGIATVNATEKDLIRLTPLDDNFIYGVLYAKAGNEQNLKQWKEIRNNFKTISSNVKGIYISLVNTMNTKNDLLLVYEGKIVYDCVEE